MNFFAVYLISAVSIFSFISNAIGATVLVPGDIAIIGFNFKDPDQFSFLLLTNVEEDTEIYFTDCGWQAGGGFRANEGVVTYKVPHGGKPSGSVITYPGDPGFSKRGIDGFFGLTVEGDQILVFQGDMNSPDFLFALNSNITAGWDSDATSNNTSALPDGLVDGVSAIALDSYINGYFDCILFHSTEAIFSAILESSRWVKSAMPVILPQECATVLDLVQINISAKEVGRDALITGIISDLKDLKYFSIEKADKSGVFKEIFRKNLNPDNQENEFSFSDGAFTTGSYYKIRAGSYNSIIESDPVFLQKSHLDSPLIVCTNGLCRFSGIPPGWIDLKIYDVLGNTFLEMRVSSPENPILDTLLQTLSSGTYFISYITEKETGRNKFVK